MFKVHVRAGATPAEVADAVYGSGVRGAIEVVREPAGRSRAWLLWFVALAVVGLLMLAYGCASHSHPPPIPTPPPEDPLAGVPWCNEAGQTCSLPGKPCKHNPTQDPGHSELAPACSIPDPLPGGGCSIDGLPGPEIPDYQAQLREAVTAAIRRARPDCDPGGTCLLGNTTRTEWHRTVIDQLRAGGLCAGEHIPGVTDEVAVAASPTGAREGWDVFSGDDSAGPVPPGKPRRTVEWKYTGAYAAPGGVPPDPAPAGECPAPRPAPAGQNGGLGRIGIKQHGPWKDITPQVYAGNPAEVPGDQNYCVLSGYGLHLWCPFRPEGHPARKACELDGLGKRVVWEADQGTVEVNPENEFQARCGGGGCTRVRACNVSRTVCSEWE